MTATARIESVRAEMPRLRAPARHDRCHDCGAPLRTAAIRARHVSRYERDDAAIERELQQQIDRAAWIPRWIGIAAAWALGMITLAAFKGCA